MWRPIELAFGRSPLTVNVPDEATILTLPTLDEKRPSVSTLLAAALEQPIDSPPLAELARGARVLLIASDQTRDCPRKAMFEALAPHLGKASSIDLAIANGTHAPRPVPAGLVPSWVRKLINHDSRNPINIVDIGTTSRGTPIRVNRALMEVDLIIATGSIQPHYFAGWSGGVKAIFPGLGENASIRHNHLLKSERGATAGNLDGNPIRSDLEETLRFLSTSCFLLNVVVDSSGKAAAAVAGDVVAAHRAGAKIGASFFRTGAPLAKRVLVSDRPPVTNSVYQACKLVAAVASLMANDCVIYVAAECGDGVGGNGEVEVVNRSIYELGLRPRLPVRHRVVMLCRPQAALPRTLFCEAASAHEGMSLDVDLVIPSAGSLILAVGRQL